MIVFLLRHADRTSGDDLNAAGGRRAKLLARMLAETGVSAAFRSHFLRAAKTLQPLQAKLPGLAVQPITFEDAEDADDYAAKVADAVRALPAAAVAVVVGHSDTVGPTISRLGGGSIDAIGPNEFDKLFVLFIAPDGVAPDGAAPDGAATLLKLRYGEPT